MQSRSEQILYKELYFRNISHTKEVNIGLRTIIFRSISRKVVEHYLDGQCSKKFIYFGLN